MWPYWIAFLIPAAMVVLRKSPRKPFSHRQRFTNWSLEWTLAVLVLTLFIGFRFEVGGDWFNYISRLEVIRHNDLQTLLTMSDPGYMFLSWLSNRLGSGIYGVNVFAAALFSTALVLFCRNQPFPWLALAVSVPYLVIVLGMGYTRQGIALAFALLGFLALRHHMTGRFVLWVVLGALFHKTAVLLLPVAALASSKNRVWTALWIGIIFLGAYLVLLADSVDAFYTNYVEAEYQSEGAFIRLLMNALPGALYLIWQRHFQLTESDSSLWRWMSIISLVLFAIYFVSPSSTAVDRIALYMLPLQIVVFSNLPIVLGRRNGGRQTWMVFVLMYYAAVQFVWLNFASHAQYWLPYRFYPLEIL